MRQCSLPPICEVIVILNRLEYNLFCKHSLRFRPDGTFKVLMLSDIQESADFNPRSRASIEALLDAAQPDMVVLGGDNCFGPDIHSLSDFKTFLDELAALFETRRLPWAHIFGNHDHDLTHELGLDIYEQQALYEQYKWCVSKHTEGIHGVTNFMLPVYKHDGNEVAFAVWCLDTNNRANDMNELVGGEMTELSVLPRMSVCDPVWDVVRFDQLMWYWNSSEELENHCGRKTPALMCMHIAPYEHSLVMNNPAECGLVGTCDEIPTPGAFNSGLFSTVLQRGDVKAISCGHTHRNDFSATYCGIQLCFDACAGFTAYGLDRIRGGRLFEICEDDPWRIHTRMIHSLDVMEESL